MCVLAAWWSVCGDFGGGDAGGGFVDDGLAVGVGGDECPSALTVSTAPPRATQRPSRLGCQTKGGRAVPTQT